MTYRFMEQHRDAHCVEKMAAVLGVSRSGYYAWRDRGESRRDAANRELVERIEKIQAKKKYRYGSPRITAELRREGQTAGRNRVARLMSEHELSARPRRQYKSTTKASESRPAAPNLLQRNFTVPRTNAAWVGDITYVATVEGWLYLAVVLDLCSRRVIGWAMSSRINTDLVLRAFLMAYMRRRPPAGLIFHSDRGSQYTSRAFATTLDDRGVVQSMSRKGDCWDNAPSEAFIGTLKTELMEGKAFESRRVAQAAIFEYMEVFYNRERLHSSLGYMTPVEYEEALAAGQPRGTAADQRAV